MKKNLYISGPGLFKSVLFSGQPCEEPSKALPIPFLAQPQGATSTLEQFLKVSREQIHDQLTRAGVRKVTRRERKGADRRQGKG